MAAASGGVDPVKAPDESVARVPTADAQDLVRGGAVQGGLCVTASLWWLAYVDGP